MQNSAIQLKEIIWEITSECKNNCKYCGSKKERHIKTDEDTIRKIADAIALYPSKEIDFSGGDPLLVPYKTLKYCVDVLKKKNVVCKILVNPFSLSGYLPAVIKTLHLFDWIGISLNTEEEVIYYNKIHEHFEQELKNITIISNFNCQNVFEFDKIREMAVRNKLWQIQFTVYNEGDSNENALYEHDSALKFLNDKVNEAVINGTKIIVADNANRGVCSAGMYSLGILYDGTIVPCLSMRSWNKNIRDLSEGDITFGLKEVWEDNFKKYRFKEFKCCKDHCKGKIIDIKSRMNSDFKKEWEKILDKINKGDPLPPYTNPYCPTPPIAVYYGVSPNITPVYGVGWPNGVMAYAVANPSIMAYAVQSYYAVTIGDISANLGSTTITNVPYTENWVEESNGLETWGVENAIMYGVEEDEE